MQLMLFRHLWGVTTPWVDAFPLFKRKRYQGIECRLPPPQKRGEFRDLLDFHNLQYIPHIFTEGQNVRDHIKSFRSQVAAAKSMGPHFINAQSGADHFSESDSTCFFGEVLKIESQAGLPVAHETHRSRILFNPWITSRLLERFADLKLCCDFSHWVCVCERLLDDQLKIIRQCADHCLHLHARVGYEQGPQVPDPRAPEYKRHVELHEKWWQLIWTAQKTRGLKVSTLTPEFGPPGYLHTLPFTEVPVSNLHEICDWQAQRQAAAFARHASW
ncbi:MAG: sugar phosphate isomerase/epimerase family protein [Limisphaerales bacterium]